jgi:hypothetical protein
VVFNEAADAFTSIALVLFVFATNR